MDDIEQTLPPVDVTTEALPPGLLSPQVPQGALSPLAAQSLLRQQQQPQPSQDTGGLLLAMAGGIDKHGPMGGAMRAASEHFILQDKLKDAKDQRDFTNKLALDKLEEAKRLNSSKISAYASKAAKDGMPKKIGSAGGQTTLLWPDGTISSHADEEVQKIWEQADAAKTQRAGIIAATQAQIKQASDPKQLEEDQKYDTQVSTARDAVDNFKAVQKQFEAAGGMSPAMNIPGAQWIAAKADTEQGRLMKSLQGLTLDEMLSKVKALPGAISDKEGERLSGPLPKAGDDSGVWRQWFEKEGPKVERMLQRAEEYKAQRQQRVATLQAMPSTLNGATTSAAPAEAPKSTPRAQAYPGTVGRDSMKISPVVQEGRDTDRVKILQQELDDESKKPDSDPRKKSNIEALNRELSGLTGGKAVAAAAPKATTPATPAAKAAPAEFLSKAKAALAKGAPRDAVIKRLKDAGYSTEGL